MNNDSRNFSLAFSSRTALGFIFNTEVMKIFQHLSAAAHLKRLMHSISDLSQLKFLLLVKYILLMMNNTQV